MKRARLALDNALLAKDAGGVRGLVHHIADRLMPTSSRKPIDVPDQREMVDDLLAEKHAWLLWFDGGRYDWFEVLYNEYFDGDLSTCWNGNISFSGDWAARTLSGQYPEKGIFTTSPFRDYGDTDYDAREHFEISPRVHGGQEIVEERLRVLGYKDGPQTGSTPEIDPLKVNSVVRRHLGEINGGVVRYLKPHPPLDGIEDLTSGTRKIGRVRDALNQGDLTWEDIEDAYGRTYHEAFEATADLLPGRVVITADHGECLGRCGQLFHSRSHAPHDHLVQVPWFEVDR